METLSDYDYHLPESSIAQEPLADRASSKLLVLHKETGVIEHRVFRDVGHLLAPDDLLVLNDTRVTAFRAFGRKETGAAVEILALKDLGSCHYECLLKPGRRLPVGTQIHFEDGFHALVESDLGDGRKVISVLGGALESFALQTTVPLPPYIHKAITDPERYQTVYARVGGSAAAPTAGLHFTRPILSELERSGVKTAWVTLDVSLDTFRPVQSDDPSQHQMHGEECELSEETANAIHSCKGRIIAVGTTSVRTLESFAVGPRQVESGRKSTKLFIRHGYKFKIIDGMFTNFHMPRTSMLMMITALAGREAVMSAYHDALESGYRFLSFGDSMLIA